MQRMVDSDDMDIIRRTAAMNSAGHSSAEFPASNCTVAVLYSMLMMLLRVCCKRVADMPTKAAATQSPMTRNRNSAWRNRFLGWHWKYGQAWRLLATLILLSLSSEQSWSDGTHSNAFETIDVPNGIGRTQAWGINNRGAVVGYAAHVDMGFRQVGFLALRDFLTDIDSPGSILTTAIGINDRGQVVGYLADSTPSLRGYVLSRGTFELIAVPDDGSVEPQDINNRGQVVGLFSAQNFGYRGFLLSRGEFTTIEVPNSSETVAHGINDGGQIVGHFVEGDGSGMHGFVLSKGTFTTIDVPGSSKTVANGINDKGQIVGMYVDAAFVEHGFLLWNGKFTTIDIPDSVTTNVNGINDRGLIVGHYLSENDETHGFKANVFGFVDRR